MMADDALDFTATAEAMGKQAGDDFREGKVTLPVILAYAAGDAQEQAFWKRTIEKLDQSEADLATALSLMEKHGTLAQTLDSARAYGDAAKQSLNGFDDMPVKGMLMDLIDFVVNRSH